MEIENLNGLITLIYKKKKRQLATGTFNLNYKERANWWPLDQLLLHTFFLQPYFV